MSRRRRKKKKKKKGTNCVERKTDTHHVPYDTINVIASFEWADPTSQLASVFKSYKEAKSTNFEYILPECSKESNSTVHEFVNNLRERKFFKCYVNPNRLGYLYFNTYDFNTFLLLVLGCSGFAALLILFLVIDGTYRLRAEYKRRDVLFYIKCHKVRGVRWRLRAKELTRQLNSIKIT